MLVHTYNPILRGFAIQTEVQRSLAREGTAGDALAVSLYLEC
jgi:hypothetical protein